MKKYVVVMLLILIMGLFQVAHGQGEMSISAGANLSLPLGSDFAGVGFGATGLFAYSINPLLSVTGTLGYIIYAGKDQEFSSGTTSSKVEYDLSAIPILGGVRYNVGGGVEGAPQPYLSGQLGLFLFSGDTKVTTEFFNPFTQQTETQESTGDLESSSEVAIGAGGGVLLGNFDLSAAILLISDLNQIMATVAYNFPIGSK